MLNEIKQNKDYDDVFNKGKKISEHVNVKINDQQHTYVLIGYPLITVIKLLVSSMVFKS